MALTVQRKDSYSELQISAYLSYIRFPTVKYPRIQPSAARTSKGLEYLNLLQKYQLASIPFENLCLHYSQHRVVSINQDDLFEKIVTEGKGRGGYCMENNLFFATMLKSMGFELLSAGARVSEAANGGSGDSYGGWSHQVTIVFIDGTPYLVDVGFGANGPTHPLPLKADLPMKWGTGPAENKLVYREASNPAFQGTWILQHRISKSYDWTNLYQFSLLEFYPADFGVMNFAVYTRATSFFTYKTVACKAILNEEGDEIVGVMILEGGIVKRRIRGETETLRECTTEKERIDGLERWLGITLDEKQKRGIRGLVSALKDE